MSSDKEKLAEIEERWDDGKVSLWPQEYYGGSEKWSFMQFKPFGGAKFITSENDTGDVRVVAEIHWGGIHQIEALVNSREDVWWLIKKVKELSKDRND